MAGTALPVMLAGFQQTRDAVPAPSSRPEHSKSA
jgi:hypothetical protein